MNNKFCTECGQSYSDHANFCSGCGKRTNNQTNPLPDVCIQCGAGVSCTAVFCKECGAKIRIDVPDIHITEKRMYKREEFNKKQDEPVLYTSEADDELTAPLTDYKPENQSLNNVSNNNNDYREQKSKVKHKCSFIKKLIIVILASTLVLTGVVFVFLQNRFTNFKQPESYDPEKTVYASEFSDWTLYPDLKKEKHAIDGRRKKLISDLENSNINKAIKYFYPDIQETWQKQMESDPEGTLTLAAVLSTAEMVFLGVENEVKEDPRSRTATYSVEFEGSIFYITWIKQDKIWYLYDF